MPQNVLCFSRSYLSNLFPRLDQLDEGADYYHIVQTDKEARQIAAKGGKVVLNLESVVRQGLRLPENQDWQEPDDFRAVTGFPWSAMYSDRNLPDLPARLRGRVARIVFEEIASLFATRQYHFFINEPVAIFATHVLLYFCRKTEVRALFWANTYFPDYFYFVSGMDISSATPIVRGPNTTPELRAVVETYVNGVIEDHAGPAYHHAFASTADTRLDYLRQRRGERPLVLKPGWISLAIQVARLARASFKRLLFPHWGDYMTAGSVSEHKAYLRYLLTPSYIYDELPRTSSNRFVVYPLQYEPEASLIYFAPEIASQHSFVETILRALPSDCLLWVKEHPNQFGALGEKKWRALKQRYGNLRFVHGRQSGRDLIKHCGPVVSISSSMGMDALLLGRKVVVAGRVYYRAFTGAIAVSSYNELAEVLNRAETYEPANNVAANIEELIVFGGNAYHGDPQPSDILFTDGNLYALATAIRAERATMPDS